VNSNKKGNVTGQGESKVTQAYRESISKGRGPFQTDVVADPEFLESAVALIN
jgi:hypothetical protein